MAAVLGFLCSFMSNAMRVNHSIAMVAMVNSTSESMPEIHKNRTTECPAGLYNSTDSAPSRGEFLWSPELQGYILSAGYAGLVLMQIPGGILAGRYGAKRVIVAGLLIASASNLLSPVAAKMHPYLLLTVTLIRGMAQGLKLPALSVLSGKWFPSNERGFLAAIANSGYVVGAVLTGIISGILCDLEFLGGWPLVFYTFGLDSLMVAILFLVFYYDRPEEDPWISESELKLIQNHQGRNTSNSHHLTPWLAILTSVRTHAFVLGIFGQSWIGFYLLSLHPLYMGTVLNIPIRQNGALTGLPLITAVIIGWVTCYSSFWISRHTKVQVDTLRKGINSLSCITFTVGMIGVYFAKCNISLHEIFLYITASSPGFSIAGSFITAPDMSPTFCGPLMGFACTIASLSGVFATIIVGKLTNEGQNLTQWGKVFIISASVSLGSGLIFQFFGSAEVQPWDPLFKQPGLEDKKEDEAQPQEMTKF